MKFPNKLLQQQFLKSGKPSHFLQTTQLPPDVYPDRNAPRYVVLSKASTVFNHVDVDQASIHHRKLIQAAV